MVLVNISMQRSRSAFQRDRKKRFDVSPEKPFQLIFYGSFLLIISISFHLYFMHSLTENDFRKWTSFRRTYVVCITNSMCYNSSIKTCADTLTSICCNSDDIWRLSFLSIFYKCKDAKLIIFSKMNFLYQHVIYTPIVSEFNESTSIYEIN